MAEKVFTNIEFAEWLKSRKGDVYWYGTHYHECSEGLLARKAKQYPMHYGKSRMARYSEDIKNGKMCSDCVGAIKGAAWSELGRHKQVYSSHGCPDKSADGMFAYCKSVGMDNGGMDSLPEIPGVAVRYAGHVGVYIGGGRVVEWRGFKYGRVETTLNSRPWTHWYMLPWVEYITADMDDTTPGIDVGALGSRLLKEGKKGEDVRILQTILMELGYALPKYGADGDYGKETADAVRAFQVDRQIGVDGRYGPVTHGELMEILNERAAQDEDEEGGAPAEPKKQVRVTGGSVYVRSGPGTQYGIERVVKKGTLLDHVATADNGWHSVIVDGEAGWIGPKYTEVVE